MNTTTEVNLSDWSEIIGQNTLLAENVGGDTPIKPPGIQEEEENTGGEAEDEDLEDDDTGGDTPIKPPS